jgi:hypothetical protein
MYPLSGKNVSNKAVELIDFGNTKNIKGLYYSIPFTVGDQISN